MERKAGKQLTGKARMPYKQGIQQAHHWNEGIYLYMLCFALLLLRGDTLTYRLQT
jgi:hypothetical protein